MFTVEIVIEPTLTQPINQGADSMRRQTVAAFRRLGHGRPAAQAFASSAAFYRAGGAGPAYPRRRSLAVWSKAA